jgi:hypothetical protein
MLLWAYIQSPSFAPIPTRHFQHFNRIIISLKIMRKADTPKLSVRGNNIEPATRNSRGRFAAKKQATCPRCGYTSTWDNNLRSHNVSCRRRLRRKPKQPTRNPLKNRPIETFLWHYMQRSSDIKPRGSFASRDEAWQSGMVWILGKNFP